MAFKVRGFFLGVFNFFFSDFLSFAFSGAAVFFSGVVGFVSVDPCFSSFNFSFDGSFVSVEVFFKSFGLSGKLEGV